MSLLSSFSSFLSDQKNRFENVFQTEKAVLGNIVNTVSFGTVGSQTTINSNQPVLKAIANNPLTTAGLIAIPASSAARASIATGFNSLSTGAKLATIAGGTLATGAIAANPSQAAKSIIEGPSNLSNFGKDVSSFAYNPSLQGAKDILTEHPVLSGASIIGAGILSSGAVSTIATALNTKAVKANTIATAEGNQTNSNDVKIASIQAKAAEEVAKINASKTPTVSPVTSSVVPSSPVVKKKKKKKKKAKPKTYKRKRKINKYKKKKRR